MPARLTGTSLEGRYLEDTRNLQSTSVRDQSEGRANLVIVSAMRQEGGLPEVETCGTSGSLAADSGLVRNTANTAKTARTTTRLEEPQTLDCLELLMR